MAFQAKLYASNTDVLNGIIIEKYPLITSVTSKVDVLVMEFNNLTGLYGGIELNSETKTLWSGGEIIKNKAKFTWNLETLPIAYSATQYSMDMVNFINKKYKWLDITDYEYRPPSLIGISNKLIAVNMTAYSFGSENGHKKITISLKERP